MDAVLGNRTAAVGSALIERDDGDVLRLQGLDLAVDVVGRRPWRSGERLVQEAVQLGAVLSVVEP